MTVIVSLGIHEPKEINETFTGFERRMQRDIFKHSNKISLITYDAQSSTGNLVIQYNYYNRESVKHMLYVKGYTDCFIYTKDELNEKYGLSDVEEKQKLIMDISVPTKKSECLKWLDNHYLTDLQVKYKLITYGKLGISTFQLEIPGTVEEVKHMLKHRGIKENTYTMLVTRSK